MVSEENDESNSQASSSSYRQPMANSLNIGAIRNAIQKSRTDFASKQNIDLE